MSTLQIVGTLPTATGNPSLICNALNLVTAQDPSAPYFDVKDSDPENPRWSIVHVEFREKFERPITLTHLKEIRAASKELQNMQMLKQSRLSVTKVERDEWLFLIGLLSEGKCERERRGEGK